MLKHSDRELRGIEQALGLEFSDISLLEQALVHSSFLAEFPGVFAESNERLEFLGDAVIDLVVAQELVVRFPDRLEGHLTQMRSALVAKESLARFGTELDLGPMLVMGKGERDRGGARRESNLADAFEALVAALFLDQGYAAARNFVLGLMDSEIQAVGQLKEELRHPKSLLHEAAMLRGYAPPEYELLERSGPDHDPVFTVRAIVDGRPIGTGSGSSIRQAEANAASKALEELSGA